MGGVLSSSTVAATNTVTNTETISKTNESHIESPIIDTKTESQIETTPLTESKETNVKVETDTKVVEDNPEEVLERYIEPTGTKLEVAPVEVAPSADVVKKNKKKNKKHH